jgi:Tfp pilus assembly PilM family ATPase
MRGRFVAEREAKMTFKNTLQMAVRRFAAGIDVNPSEVRLVVLSRRARGDGPVRVECIASVPMRAGAMAGAEIVDRPAVARALAELLEGLPTERILYALRCAMAVPGSATLTANVPVAQFGPRRRGCYGATYGHAAFEAAVMIEAERIAGLERHALAVDWYVTEVSPDAGCVTIAATARQHLEARLECAAIAGVSLTAVDSEPRAALRALRHAADHEPCVEDAYAALWVAPDGLYGWRIVDDAIAAEVRYPALEYAGIADALRDLGGGQTLGRALVAGELDLLEGVSFSLAEIADVLACGVVPFQCAAFGEVVRASDEKLLYEPGCAVAFGLALREVLE